MIVDLLRIVRPKKNMNSTYLCECRAIQPWTLLRLKRRLCRVQENINLMQLFKVTTCILIYITLTDVLALEPLVENCSIPSTSTKYQSVKSISHFTTFQWLPLVRCWLARMLKRCSVQHTAPWIRIIQTHDDMTGWPWRHTRHAIWHAKSKIPKGSILCSVLNVRWHQQLVWLFVHH